MLIYPTIFLKMKRECTFVQWKQWQCDSSQWLESRLLVTRTRVTLRKMVTRVMFFTEWLHSSHSQCLETIVRVILKKSLSSRWTNPVHLHTKNLAFFASVVIRFGRNFLFCLSSGAVLHFEDQVSPTCLEGDWRLCFHWGVSRAQYIDTLLWFNVVFAYRDHVSGPHTVTLTLFQLPVKWFKFFRFKSKPNYIAKYNANARNESSLNPNSCHCY